MDGCPECIAEQTRLGAAQKSDSPVSIVKVRFVNHTTGEPEGREYTYFTAEPLGLGVNVKAPVRAGFTEAKVVAVNVPDTEIAAFRDKVKTIPAGSIMVRPAPDLDFGTPAPEIVVNQEPVKAEDWNKAAAQEITADPPPLVGTAVIAISPKADSTVLDLYQEGVRLHQFAQARVITDNEDLKPAVDDLAVIAKTKKALEEKKADYVGPIRQHLNQVNDAFKDFLRPFEEADRITRGQVKSFRDEQTRKAAEVTRIEAEKLRLAQEEAALSGTGEHTQELGTAVAPPPVPEHTRTDLGTQGFQKVYKWEVTDFAQVPDQYKVINSGMVTGVVKGSKGKITIPGIRVFEDETVRINTR